MNSSEDPTAHSASPLERVVDDETPRREALAWATAEVAAGRGFDDVAAELVATGWSVDDADAIVEGARQATRPLRGERSRADVLADVNRRYRKSMSGGWFIGLPTVSAGMRLLYALGSLLSLRRRHGRRKDDNIRRESP